MGASTSQCSRECGRDSCCTSARQEKDETLEAAHPPEVRDCAWVEKLDNDSGQVCDSGTVSQYPTCGTENADEWITSGKRQDPRRDKDGQDCTNVIVDDAENPDELKCDRDESAGDCQNLEQLPQQNAVPGVCHESEPDNQKLPVSIGNPSPDVDASGPDVAKIRQLRRSAYLNRLTSAGVLILNIVGIAYITPWCTYDSVSSPSSDVLMQSKAPQSFSPLGANLGGWLVLERWQGASGIFEGIPDHVEDEWALCEYQGMQECTKNVNAHRDNYMAEADLVQLKSAGFEAVRVPFGYWEVETFPGDMYVGNGTHHLDNVVGWAKKSRSADPLGLTWSSWPAKWAAP
jgi:hypothetical protein